MKTLTLGLNISFQLPPLAAPKLLILIGIKGLGNSKGGSGVLELHSAVGVLFDSHMPTNI